MEEPGPLCQTSSTSASSAHDAEEREATATDRGSPKGPHAQTKRPMTAPVETPRTATPPGSSVSEEPSPSSPPREDCQCEFGGPEGHVQHVNAFCCSAYTAPRPAVPRLDLPQPREEGLDAEVAWDGKAFNLLGSGHGTNGNGTVDSWRSRESEETTAEDLRKMLRERGEALSSMQLLVERQQREIAQLRARLEEHEPQGQGLHVAHHVLACANGAGVVCRCCGATFPAEQFSAHVLTCSDKVPACVRTGGGQGLLRAAVEEAELVQQISVRIPSSRTESGDGKPFVLYAIQVTAGAKEWTIERRYREFLDLQRRLQKAFPRAQLKPLARKWRSVSSAEVEQRREDLAQSLHTLVRLFPARLFPPLRDFLAWDRNFS